MKKDLLELVNAFSDIPYVEIIIPLVHRAISDLADKEFLSVQPLILPSKLIPYLDYPYGMSSRP